MYIGRMPTEVLEQYLGGELDVPVVFYGNADDAGRVLAAGGLAWKDGRCIGFIDVFADYSKRSLTLVRWARRVLRVAQQLGETEVVIFRDAWQPASERLIGLLGFEMVGVAMVDDTCKEIYACQVSEL